MRGQRLCLLSSVVFLCFFFSSRRRHTRFDCDWSSDVCSSDLLVFFARSTSVPPTKKTSCAEAASTSRSEERRVGKESRSRWRPLDLKKKHGTSRGRGYKLAHTTTVKAKSARVRLIGV